MDIYFARKFNSVVSLGSNCYPKFFISKILKPEYGETQLFDFIGSSMWSINSLLLNDFADLTNPLDFEKIPILENEAPIVTNTKYYLRFKHDLKTLGDLEGVEFRDKINRRIVRFKKTIEYSSKLLFIRYQESQKGRIVYTPLLRSELEELEEFIDIIHIKFKCKSPIVIYINLDIDGWNERRDILSVKVDTLDCDWTKAHKIIETLFIEKNVVQQLDMF